MNLFEGFEIKYVKFDDKGRATEAIMCNEDEGLTIECGTAIYDMTWNCKPTSITGKNAELRIKQLTSMIKRSPSVKGKSFEICRHGMDFMFLCKEDSDYMKHKWFKFNDEDIELINKKIEDFKQKLVSLWYCQK